MRPETRLESAVFQLTPTRTRCDLVVVANGQKEKIASGLLNPFVAHLKVAQEQIAKGGYSITLEPDLEVDAPWFTRGTVERFVRFVSTPEVLERVTTIEAEILQIMDAIAVQSNDTLGLRSASLPCWLTCLLTGSKTSNGPDADNALVLYKPVTQPTPPMQNHSATQEENSKAQLLRVLETRKTVLRKEQAMAFARAVAAGFDIDNLLYLIIFAERFGASRLKKACTQFMELWKQKHETGQWIEVEPEAMSTRSEFPPFNPAGILFMGDNMKHNMETISISNGDADGEDASKAGQRTPQQSGPTHEYFRGPYQSAYPPWAMHPPPYSMQSMPYYPGMNPYYPPPYPQTDDTRYHHSERRSRRNSSDSNDSEQLDEESDQSSSERGTSHGHKSHKKGKKRGKKKPSVVVIRNVNVTSTKHATLESDSQIGSDIASDDSDDSHTESRKKKNKRSSSKKKEARQICIESANEFNNDEMSYGQDGDQGNWNAFQNVLLRADERTKDNDANLFSSEKEPHLARMMESRSFDDPILLAERDSVDTNERNAIGLNSVNGKIRPPQMLSGDDLIMSVEGRSFSGGDIKEIEAGSRGYRRGTTDDFMIYGQEKPMDRDSSLDPFAEAQYKSPSEVEKSVHCMPDESFIVPLRSTSEEKLGLENRSAIDIDVELPPSIEKISDSRVGDQLFYEPDELMPERGYEEVSFGYDPAMDYGNHMQIQPATMVEDAPVEDASLSVEVELQKPEKDKRLKSSQDSLDKRRKDASAKRLSSSRGPLTDAQKRAQNLRAYKADLQKAKKEQEEEQIKRLEKLKLERQKRIAARSNAPSATSTPQQPKVKPSPKLSPSGYKGSKFNDAEPASSSPHGKLPAKTTPGTDPPKAAKASKLGDNTNAVSKSTSSLSEMKKEKSGRTGSSNERLKKLAEPKTNLSTDHPLSSKSVKMDHSRRRSTPQDTQIKKISAIMQLDQSKSATLPELKVKSPRAPSVVMIDVVAAKEKKEGSPAAKASSIQQKKNNGNIARMSNSDDSLVIEKTVVSENEVALTPPVILHSERIIDKETSSDHRMEKPLLELEDTAIRAPPFPVIPPEAEDLVISGSGDQESSYEVVAESRKDGNETPTLAAMEKPYQAPFARVTSLENASANSPADPQPIPGQELESQVHSESIKARVPESLNLVSVEESHGVNVKPRSKEPRGFRKLLKLGRKGHSPGLNDGAICSDASSIDEATAGNGMVVCPK
ncbi:hypothetical protein PR202_gb29601 [Eleusine coracana subsp. coracana]|uniref:COP1-interacting protein 7 n=1 Tax=Eleusine coracana subsp. coracana TaxID=191504 RepID=A0AAV5FXF8_ELECO|nr:hypothetical protein PR202_gb29601 [Eleusine coracana subsp. coracana]